MRLFFLLFICLWAATATFGQVTISNDGNFQVDEIKGCAPFTINITNPDLTGAGRCVPGKACLMDFEGTGTTSTNLLSHTYNTPGKYTLRVQYQSSTTVDEIDVTVVENIDPTFEVYTCTGNQVTIKVTDKSYDTYSIDFNTDGTPETTIPMGNNATAQFNYGAAGTYNISVQGKNLDAANNCKILSESYTTLTTLPTPSINLMTALDANNLQLDMTTAPHILYKLEIAINNGSTFQVLPPDIYQTSTITIPSLLVDDNYYCFRLSAFDPCAGTNVYSNMICSQDFDVEFQNGVNALEWNTWPTGITRVYINRNESPLTNFPVQFAYEDKDYTCKQEYCYEIVMEYAGGVRSTSLTKCGIGRLETTFPPIENITSVVRAGAELTWTADLTLDIQAFDINKSTPGQSLREFAQSTTPLYIDGTYDYAGGSCYQVNYHDVCGNRSTPGIIACPMGLSGIMDELTNAVTLSWNSYKGYNLGVTTYEVNKYNKSGGLLGVFPTTDTTFVDNDPSDENQVVIYTIVAVATEPGVDKSISNNITIEKPVRLYLPTAFTPNGDGINPLFTISGKFVSKMSIQIFDRWGVLVFQSDKNEPWDGTKGGKVMPESAYVWKAEVEDFAGNVFTREGTVLLLRPPR